MMPPAENPTAKEQEERNRLLLLAAKEGDLEKCRKLIMEGADIAAETPKGSNGVSFAAENGNVEMCKMFLAGGAAADKPTEDAWRPLHRAAWYGHPEIVRLLLDYGPELEAKGEKGWTPLQLAAHEGHTEAALLLLKHGADVDAGAEGRTAREWARRKGHEDTAAALDEAVSLRHAEKVKALKVLRDRKR